MSFFGGLFGGLFAAETRREARIAELLREKSILVISNLELLESLEYLKAEVNLRSEEAAAERLRNADLTRQLEAERKRNDRQA